MKRYHFGAIGISIVLAAYCLTILMIDVENDSLDYLIYTVYILACGTRCLIVVAYAIIYAKLLQQIKQS